MVTLAGRFGKSEYGLSKQAGEELFFDYGMETGAKVLVYRFPNLVGMWVRPEYNSAVGTFCHHIANDLPITVNDSSVELEMLFIDDLVEEIQAVHMLPGYTHNIINLSETENLVTLMWANEIFDPSKPDTFFEPV